MDACSCDSSNASLNVNDTTWANRFVSCQSFVINGFAAEGNVISKHDTSFFWIDNCIGFVINGVYMLGTIFDGITPATYTAFQFIRMTLHSSAIINGWLTAAYGGACSFKNSPDAIYFVYSDADCDAIITSSRLATMTILDAGGTPTNYVGFVGGTTKILNSRVESGWTQLPPVVENTSGTYTPTIVNDTNVSASTSRLTRWFRVGNEVTVGGYFGIDATSANVATIIRIDLPIASDLAAAQDLTGTAISSSLAGANMAIYADAATNTALFYAPGGWTNAANQQFIFTFTYTIK